MACQQALQVRYNTYAHGASYRVLGKKEHPRLNLGAEKVLGDDIEFDCVLFDVDAPWHGQSRPDEATCETWFIQEIQKWASLPPFLLERLGWYETKGGYRLVWTLDPRPKVAEFVDLLKNLNSVLLSHGILPDPKCLFWHRLFALPFVMRDGQRLEYQSDFSALSNLLDWREVPVRPLQKLSEAPIPFVLPATIPEGQRHPTMTRLAGSLRRVGASFEAILATLRTENKRCIEPLVDLELERIAKNIGAKDSDPAADGTRLERGSEVEIASYLLDRMEPEGTIVASEGAIYQCRDALWREVPRARVMQDVAMLDGLPYGPKNKQLSVGIRMMENVVTIMRTKKADDSFFTDLPYGVAFRDCFVGLDGAPEPLREEHRQRHVLPFDFMPDVEEPQEFLRFLNSCFLRDVDAEDKNLAIGEFLGSALLGTAQSMGQIMLLLGDGANGKSTLQAIARALMPLGSVVSVTPQVMGQEYRRAVLCGARLNLVSELPEQDILDTESLKSIIDAQNPIDARKPYGEVFHFLPRCAHLFAANNLPALRDLSTGFWRRWILIKFNRVFLKAEQEQGLATRLIRTELPAIASWAVRLGVEAYLRGAYTRPASADSALNGWRDSADSVSGYASECLDFVGPLAQWPTVTRHYDSYVLWARKNGYHQVAKRKFLARLEHLWGQPSKGIDGLKYPRKCA